MHIYLTISVFKYRKCKYAYILNGLSDTRSETPSFLRVSRTSHSNIIINATSGTPSFLGVSRTIKAFLLASALSRTPSFLGVSRTLCFARMISRKSGTPSFLRVSRTIHMTPHPNFPPLGDFPSRANLLSCLSWASEAHHG